MHIASSDASVKTWSLKFMHPLSKYNRFIDIVRISCSSEHQSLKTLTCSADNSLSHDCPMDTQMLLRRNLIRMVKGEQIPMGSNTAETKDNTTLWVIFAGISWSIPRQTTKLSESTFQFSPRIEDDWGSTSKVLTAFVDLSSSGICDLTFRHLWSI